MCVLGAITVAALARESAISFPWIPEWPGTQASVTEAPLAIATFVATLVLIWQA